MDARRWSPTKFRHVGTELESLLMKSYKNDTMYITRDNNPKKPQWNLHSRVDDGGGRRMARRSEAFRSPKICNSRGLRGLETGHNNTYIILILSQAGYARLMKSLILTTPLASRI